MPRAREALEKPFAAELSPESEVPLEGDRRLIQVARAMEGRLDPSWVESVEGHAPRQRILWWPARQGRGGRGFGSGGEHYHYGIDIVGPRGSRIRAAAAGRVVYVGEGLQGYGKVVLLLHPGKYLTLYAHNDRVHVREGQWVEPGAAIADLGNTGLSQGPHLHFELWYKGQRCDPEPLLRFSESSRGRSVTGVAEAVWVDADDKPPVRCRTPSSR